MIDEQLPAETTGAKPHPIWTCLPWTRDDKFDPAILGRRFYHVRIAWIRAEDDGTWSWFTKDRGIPTSATTEAEARDAADAYLVDHGWTLLASLEEWTALPPGPKPRKWWPQWPPPSRQHLAEAMEEWAARPPGPAATPEGR